MGPEETCIGGSDHDAEGRDEGDGTTHFLCRRCRYEWYEEDQS